MANDDYHVFFSYNRSDPMSHLVGDLAAKFAALDHNVFFDADDLAEGRGQPIPAALKHALGRTRLILIMVGSAGLGPDQKKEVAEAMRLSEEAKTKGERWPEVAVVRLTGMRHEELEGLIPEELIEPLSFVYKPAPAQASFKELVAKLRETPPSTSNAGEAETAQGNSESEQEANGPALPFPEMADLCSQIREEGVVAVLGTNWPDRHLMGVFDPEEIGQEIRKALEVPENIAPGAPLEAVAGYAQLALENSEGIVKKLRDHFAVRPPLSYVELVELIVKTRELKPLEWRDGGRPFVLMTTAQNALLEQELVSKGVGFLLIRVNGNVCDQTYFDVRDYNPLTIGNGLKAKIEVGAKVETIPRQVQQFIVEGLEDLEPGSTWDQVRHYVDKWTNASEIKVAAGPPLDGDHPEYNLYRSVYYKGNGPKADQEAWDRAEYARIVMQHTSKYAVTAPWIVKNNAQQRSLIDWCLAHEIPIVIKLCGCVHGDEEIRMRFSRLTTMGEGAEMFPTWLRKVFNQAPAVFAGFSPVDYAFQTMYWRELAAQFRGRRERIFFSPEIVDSDRVPENIALDNFLAPRLHKEKRPRESWRAMLDVTFVTGLRASEAFQKMKHTIGR